MRYLDSGTGDGLVSRQVVVDSSRSCVAGRPSSTHFTDARNVTSRTTSRGGWTLLIGALALAPGALLGGCATFPAAEELRDTVAVYPGGALPAVHDGRARFRQIFCELVEP